MSYCIMCTDLPIIISGQYLLSGSFNIMRWHFPNHCKALNSLLCADVPLRNYSLTHFNIMRGLQRELQTDRGSEFCNIRLLLRGG